MAYLSSALTPSGTLTLYHQQVKVSRSSFLEINKFRNNNVLYSRNLHLGAGRKASSTSFTIRARAIDVESAAQKMGPTAVPIIDGLEPAVLTPPGDLRRKDFPKDFKFGASTSAIQTEGDGTEGGRGPSTWDFMIQKDKGFKATDSYTKYERDVELLKDMGMNSYRFSISWSRILPDGTGKVNQEGIDFYNALIDKLLDNGIEPVVTLFHFDLPVALDKKYGGFLSENIIDDFTNYAKVCFEAFGKKVKYWSTINEPYVYAVGAYAKDPFKATHNILLAHATAAKLYHDKYQKTQKGKMSISLPCQWFEPRTIDPKDVDAAQKQLDFMLGWYMEPFVSGDYPDSMRVLVPGLPVFTKKEQKMLKSSCDFIGLNYYTSRFATGTFGMGRDGTIQAQYIQHTDDAAGNPIGPQCKGQDQIYVYPPGLKNLLLYITEKYDKPEIVVTENGVPDAPTITQSVQAAIQDKNYAELSAAFMDDYRISHAEQHLINIREAIRQGANVKGFFVWTLMDNMEVGAGYTCRFGLNFTDYKDSLKRYPKKSAKWFDYFLNDKFDKPKVGKDN